MKKFFKSLFLVAALAGFQSLLYSAAAKTTDLDQFKKALVEYQKTKLKGAKASQAEHLNALGNLDAAYQNVGPANKGLAKKLAMDKRINIDILQERYRKLKPELAQKDTILIGKGIADAEGEAEIEGMPSAPGGYAGSPSLDISAEGASEAGSLGSAAGAGASVVGGAGSAGAQKRPAFTRANTPSSIGGAAPYESDLGSGAGMSTGAGGGQAEDVVDLKQEFEDTGSASAGSVVFTSSSLTLPEAKRAAIAIAQYIKAVENIYTDTDVARAQHNAEAKNKDLLKKDFLQSIANLDSLSADARKQVLDFVDNDPRLDTNVKRLATKMGSLVVEVQQAKALDDNYYLPSNKFDIMYALVDALLQKLTATKVMSTQYYAQFSKQIRDQAAKKQVATNKLLAK